MANIPDAYKKVPLMFQAQTNGRCQLQRLDPDRRETRDQDRQPQDAEIWCEEWTSETDPAAPKFEKSVKTRGYSISWRFVTNSGQDDGVIRPVIGASGYPFYPGSSMKGAFRQACRKLFGERVGRYCGQELTGGDFTPGILRFHGGYPTDDRWCDDLVDEVAEFPAGAHDDYVDTVSMAMHRFRRGGYVTTQLDAEDEPVYFKSNRNRGYY